MVFRGKRLDARRSTTICASLVIACALFLASCGLTTTTGTGADQTPATAHGTLSGDVVAGPTCPVENKANPCPPTPVASREVTITAAGGTTTTTTTDGQGHFSVDLAPGAYSVQVALVPGAVGIRQPTPAEVTITAGQTTHVKLTLDTGIRSATQK